MLRALVDAMVRLLSMRNLRADRFGTLAAVLLFFREDIREMLAALPRAFTASPGPVGRRIQLIAIGTLPIVVAGAIYTDAVEAALRTPAVAAVALVVGAGLLLIIERLSARTGGEESLTAGGALASVVPCAATALPADPELGALLAVATADLQGQPVSVLAFSVDRQRFPAANGTVRIYAFDPASCAVVATVTTR